MPIFAAVIHSNHRKYEYRECKITDAQGDAGVLRAAPAEAPAVLRQRHHPTAEGCRTARGGGHALPPADPPEERRAAQLPVAGVHPGTSAQVLHPQP